MNNFESLRVARLIWAALLLLIFVFNFVSLKMNKGVIGSSINFNDPQVMAFSLFAILNLFLSRRLPEVFLRGTKSKSLQQNESVDRGLFFTAYVVRWVLLVSVGIFGFALSAVKHDSLYSLLFSSLTIVGLLISFPNAKALGIDDS